MNAPLLQRDAHGADATLGLFALFHLNLAFSSIEEERRDEVIRCCYWPLLELARKHGPIGIEASGYTLEEIAARDPSWCEEARRLIAAGRIEPIGSGYTQMIGPLVPARVTEANLRIGHASYERLLGRRPTLALVNEQAYSAGLVGLYLDAGYRAILMDWDNCAAHHPEWPADTRYRPQRALGSCGRSIALLWTNTVAFQKLQRRAYDDIPLEDYLRYVGQQRGASPRLFCLYASDAEIFDFRPGRFRTEEALGSESEWARIGDAFAALAARDGMHWIAPSVALESFSAQPPPTCHGPQIRATQSGTNSALPADAPIGDHSPSSLHHLGGPDLRAMPEEGDASLRLESAACPVPVKKQRKYNLSRWAVTGRDDLGINAACERIARALMQSSADDTAWKELCYLWSSDFRTHITEKRWRAYCARLARAEERWVDASDGPPPSFVASSEGHLPRKRGRKEEAASPMLSSPIYGPPTPRLRRVYSPVRRNCEEAKTEGGGACEACDGGGNPQNDVVTTRHIDIATPSLTARLDRRRGLAIQSLRFAGDARATIGGLPHGHFDDIALQADWYTGDCVFEAPGEHKVTDLEWCEARLSHEPNGDVIAVAHIETPNGPIIKTMRFHARQPRIDFDLLFAWERWGRGSLRLGHITLLPDAFDWECLTLTTHNGGKNCETFPLKDHTIEHGAPVSFLVSCSHGFGMTEGWAEIGDADVRIKVEVERETAPLLGLLTHRRIGGSLFCQLILSALEFDETCKPEPYRPGPRRIGFSLSRVAPSVHC